MSEDDIRVEDLEADEEIYDLAEQEEVEIDIEAPEADAAEQHRIVGETVDHLPTSIPDDVDPADAAEQSRVVEFDEDDYR